jgi:hypothetical protein
MLLRSRAPEGAMLWNRMAASRAHTHQEHMSGVQSHRFGKVGRAGVYVCAEERGDGCGWLLLTISLARLGCQVVARTLGEALVLAARGRDEGEGLQSSKPTQSQQTHKHPWHNAS